MLNHKEGYYIVARPNKYETHVKPKLELIEGWARDGLVDEEIANNLGIALSTFYEYKKEFSEFSESLKENREVVDYKVENALMKRALGYQYVEKTLEANSMGKMRVKKVVTKEIAPDVTAQIFWLKNRRPKQWRERPEPLSEDRSKLAELVNAIESAARGSDNE